MRRSLLFIPSNNPAMLQNADIFGADSVIFDLEDAVNITEKDNARNLLYYYLNAHKDLPMEVVVRINGLDTKYHKEDLEKIVSDNIDTIMLPKATIEYVNELDKLLTEIESQKKMSKKIKVLPIIELAISVLQVETIASLNRVDGILLGAEDLTSEILGYRVGTITLTEQKGNIKKVLVVNIADGVAKYATYTEFEVDEEEEETVAEEE